MLIETREELINALMDGAELENNLACLYLFAAFSIKDVKQELEGVPEDKQPEVLDILKSWKRQILGIAKQEMGHLGTVCNVLTLVGAEAHFDRPNFPPPPGYYPPIVSLELERFCENSLGRFIEFERNADQPGAVAEGMAPRGVSYQHVGELYAAILEAFLENGSGGIQIIDEQLFLGYDKAMDRNWQYVDVYDFGLGSTPPTAKDKLRAEVRKALSIIVEEGEGSNTPEVDSHYELFFRIRTELRQLLVNYPNFDPARNVALNPMCQIHRGSGTGINLITAQAAKDVSELLNSFYGTMLLALRQTYAFSENLNDALRMENMHSVCVQLMQKAIAPLGTILTKMPISDNSNKKAGPGFELYRPLYISDKPHLAWSVILERVQLAIAECDRLVASGTLANEVSTAIRKAKAGAVSIQTPLTELL